MAVINFTTPYALLQLAFGWMLTCDVAGGPDQLNIFVLSFGKISSSEQCRNRTKFLYFFVDNPQNDMNFNFQNFTQALSESLKERNNAPTRLLLNRQALSRDSSPRPSRLFSRSSDPQSSPRTVPMSMTSSHSESSPPTPPLRSSVTASPPVWFGYSLPSQSSKTRRNPFCDRSSFSLDQPSSSNVRSTARSSSVLERCGHPTQM